MALWNDFQESKARTGKGSGIYTDYFRTDGKFALLLPTVDTPFITSEIGEIEVKVSSSSTVTKIEGTETLNAAETTVYMHRDNIRLLEKVNGKTINIIAMAGDFTGYKSSVTVSYSPNSAAMDDAWQGTIKLTPVTKPEFVDNCYPQVIPTAHFASAIPALLELKVGVKHEFTVETKPTTASITVASGSATTATATAEEGKVSIEAKAEGSCVVTYKTNLDGYAEWETTTLVIVSAA